MGTRANSVPLGLRVSQDASNALKGLAEKLDISKTAVLEIVIREREKSEGVEETDLHIAVSDITQIKPQTAEDFRKFRAKIKDLGPAGSLAPARIRANLFMGIEVSAVFD